MKRNLSVFLILAFSLFTFAVFNGCSEAVTEPDLQLQNSQKDFQILTFNKNANGLNKIITVSDWVTVEDGGELELEYEEEYEKEDIEVKVKIKLEVEFGAIQEDIELSLSLDDQDLTGGVNMTFGPHGTDFLRPAILNIKAEGIDLSMVDDPSRLDIYYVNSETGVWEKMEREAIIVDVEEGKLEVVNAKIPHFSRYALALS